MLIPSGHTIITLPGWWKLSLSRLASSIPSCLHPSLFAHITGVNHLHKNKRQNASKIRQDFHLGSPVTPRPAGDIHSAFPEFPLILVSPASYFPSTQQEDASLRPLVLTLTSSWKALSRYASHYSITCASPSQPGLPQHLFTLEMLLHAPLLPCLTFLIALNVITHAIFYSYGFVFLLPN